MANPLFSNRLRGLCALVALMGTLSACGGDDPGSGTKNPPPGTGALLPWKVGNSWTYQVTDGGEVSEKTTTIGALETIGGTGPHASEQAYKVTTRKGTDLADKTESWQAPWTDAPQRIVRYREISYGAKTGAAQQEDHWAPYKLHIDGTDEKLVTGTTWREDYEETKTSLGDASVAPTTSDESERWTVISTDEAVTVGGTQYEHAIHFQKFTSVSKEYWYLRGVGKLKETGSSQIEELLRYNVAAE